MSKTIEDPLLLQQDPIQIKTEPEYHVDQHEESNTNNELQCPICFKISSTKKSYQSHLWKHYKDSGSCKTCGNDFKSKKGFKEHWLMCNQGDTKPRTRSTQSTGPMGGLTCQFCQEGKFETLAELKKHILYCDMKERPTPLKTKVNGNNASDKSVRRSSRKRRRKVEADHEYHSDFEGDEKLTIEADPIKTEVPDDYFTLNVDPIKTELSEDFSSLPETESDPISINIKKEISVNTNNQSVRRSGRKRRRKIDADHEYNDFECDEEAEPIKAEPVYDQLAPIIDPIQTESSVAEEDPINTDISNLVSEDYEVVDVPIMCDFCGDNFENELDKDQHLVQCSEVPEGLLPESRLNNIKTKSTSSAKKRTRKRRKIKIAPNSENSTTKAKIEPNLGENKMNLETKKMSFGCYKCKRRAFPCQKRCQEHMKHCIG